MVWGSGGGTPTPFGFGTLANSKNLINHSNDKSLKINCMGAWGHDPPPQFWIWDTGKL